MSGTTFYSSSAFENGITTDSLNLVQTSVNVQAPEPRVITAEVPHRNGLLDLTDALGAVTYANREISWEFTVTPGVDYPAARHNVESSLNGKRFYIVLDEDPNWAYIGRVKVNNFARDGVLQRITVTASAEPDRARVTDA